VPGKPGPRREEGARHEALRGCEGEQGQAVMHDFRLLILCRRISSCLIVSHMHNAQCMMQNAQGKTCMMYAIYA